MSLTDAQIDAKLARISSRMQAERDSIRARISADPTLLQLAEKAWASGGGFLWLKLPGFEQGRNLPAGVVIAQQYVVKKRRRSECSTGNRLVE